MARAKSDQPSEVAKLFSEAFAQSTREANVRALAAGVDGAALLASGGAPKPPPRSPAKVAAAPAKAPAKAPPPVAKKVAPAPAKPAAPPPAPKPAPAPVAAK